MIPGCSSSCGIEQKFRWHICGWWNSTWNMVTAVSLSRGNFTSTASLLGISLATKQRKYRNFHSYSFIKELGFLCAHATQGLMFPLFSSEWNTRPSTATTTLCYEDTSYWNGWKSSITITVPYKFHYHHSAVLNVTYSLYATPVTNFAADSPVSKFSINPSFSLLNSNCLKMATYITVKIKGQLLCSLDGSLHNLNFGFTISTIL